MDVCGDSVYALFSPFQICQTPFRISTLNELNKRVTNSAVYTRRSMCVLKKNIYICDYVCVYVRVGVHRQNAEQLMFFTWAQKSLRLGSGGPVCHVRWLLDIPHSPFGRSSRVQTFAHYAVPPFGTHVDCHQRSYRPSGPKLLSRLSVGLVQVVDPGPSPVPSRLNTLNLGWSSSSSIPDE